MSDIKEPKFSAETLELVEKIKKRYPKGKERSALLPILHIAQAEFGGWLSAEVMDYVASLLEIQPIEVYEVASFYTMYNLEPVGNCVIEVCHTGPCQLKGAGDIIKHFEKKLGIKLGETTADGKYTLRGVECLAACGTAPVMKVGWQYHENLTTDKVDEFLAEQEKTNTSSHVNPY